jgi:hypothetical protein
MTHWRARRRLSEFLDGTLSERARRSVAAHLDGCEACRSELRELRATVALLRSLPALDDPPYLATRILARVEAGDAAPGWRDRARDLVGAVLSNHWTPAACAVALLFVAAIALRVQVHIQLPGDGPAQPQLASIAPSAPRSFQAPEVALTTPAALPSTPVRERRRFDVFVVHEASGVWRACAARPRDLDCREFRRQFVDLALHSPPVFVNELAAFPPMSRDRVLGAISMEARRAGNAERVVERLRTVRDPRAEVMLVSLERSIASHE